MKRCAVRTAVATIWTDPHSSREIDEPALQYPVHIQDWLSRLTHEQRLDLCTSNRTQTQALFGQEVLKVREENGWAEVHVVDQPTAKSELGYPGWIPINQLEAVPNLIETYPYAFVQAKTATLYHMNHEVGMEISFQTRLPIIESDAAWVVVQTPIGKGKLRKEDIRVVYPNDRLWPDSGEQLVELARTFRGLPYLWAGMSGFGFDCSGFVYQLHRAFDLTIPRDASEQAKQGIKVGSDELQPGDLLYFAYEEGKGRVHHVAMYTGDGRMIHAPNTGKQIEEIPISGIYAKEHCISRRYWSPLTEGGSRYV
ncbi:C40 family peptidase [Alkalicoccobacillus gibsonii]|uniref:C40 family peptidase n=1 Tax=Alkalicoccobacillus gibsonii TaxID=79881 RepID=UPI0035176222